MCVCARACVLHTVYRMTVMALYTPIVVCIQIYIYSSYSDIGVKTESERTSRLQDWNTNCKRNIWEFEKGDAKELNFCYRRQWSAAEGARSTRHWEETFGTIECASGYIEVQWNNFKGCVLDTVSDLVGTVERRSRKPWITQEMISKIDERRKQRI